MPYNPSTVLSASDDSVALGRPASSTRYNKNVVQAMSHVAGRRMGIISCQPPHPTQGTTITDVWHVGTAMTGTNYICHGTRLSGSYDELAADCGFPFFGHTRDQGAPSVAFFSRTRITNSEQQSQFPAPRPIPMEVTGNFSDKTSTSPILTTQTGSDLMQVNFGRPAAGFTSRYYVASEYNDVYRDAGNWQITTKDLHSVQFYTDPTAYPSGFALVQIQKPSDLTELETNRATVAVTASFAPPTGATTANWGRADLYLDSALIYQSDNDEDR